MDLDETLKNSFLENKKVCNSTLDLYSNEIINIVSIICTHIINGKKILWCGNGGSAADCNHLSAEFVGKFNKERISLNSISLCSDAPLITCIANDFGYENIFSRQIEGIAQKGDILVALSTSGESENIIRALKN